MTTTPQRSTSVDGAVDDPDVATADRSFLRFLPGRLGRSAQSGRARRLRLPSASRVAAVATVLYLVWIVADQVLLGVDGRAFVSVRTTLGAPLGRVLVALVMLGVWFHLLDGLARLAVSSSAALAERQRVLRAGVVFATWACWLPAAVVVLWPLWGAPR